MSVTDRVRDIVAPICTDLGLEIYDVEHGPGRVRVTVDKPGGVDLNDLAVATRLMSRELDHRDPVPGKYQLEVSSPGLERPLRTPAHYRQAVGRSVSLRLHPGPGEERRLAGVITAADDEGVTIEPTAAPGEAGALQSSAPRWIRYADIERARTTFVWGPPPKPGKGPRPSRPSKPREDAEETA